MKNQERYRELLDLTEELEKLNLRREQVADRIDTLLSPIDVTHPDRDGKDINIGDRVSILTAGKYSFREGAVVRIGKLISIKSDNGDVTTRKASNLRVL